MFSILATVIIAIGVCYLLRWGYLSIIKRQRMDWAMERKLTKESIIKAYRINGRLTRWCWKYSAMFSPKTSLDCCTDATENKERRSMQTGGSEPPGRPFASP